MSVEQEYGDRFIGNIEGVFVAIIAGALAAIGETMAEVAEPTDSAADGSIWALFFVIQNYPVIIAIVGLGIVFLAAGPFGLLGFLLEAAGASVFLTDPITGMVLFAIGAGIIVVGARIWRWMPVIEWFFSNRGGRRGRGGYGR